MANSLLDFVMSVVRDPEIAARYAADPGQTIADAHLTDVSSVDVDNLIPVVSESLSMTGGNGGFVGSESGVDGNVWASGAATAAFDAFGDHLPVDVAAAHVPLIDDAAPAVPTSSTFDDAGAGFAPLDDPSPQVTEPAADLGTGLDTEQALDWGQPIVDDGHHHGADGSFDFFD